MRLASAIPLVLLLLAGCGGGAGRPASGIVVGPDGQPRLNNPANNRAETERTIQRALDRELAPGWRSQVAIADEPRWDGDRDEWLWPATAVRIELTGDPAVPPALDAQTITTAVMDYFADRLADPRQQVRVSVATAVPPSAAPPSAAPPSAAPPVVAPPAAATAVPDAPQRYAIQPGDTLARISAVFYGSPRHWRRIVDANPGLLPEALPVGQEIVIPPLPTP